MHHKLTIVGYLEWRVTVRFVIVRAETIFARNKLRASESNSRLPQVLVLWMGEVTEACEPDAPPPPCGTVWCHCAGFGFQGAPIQILPWDCIPFPNPCSNSADLCNQCKTESGCGGNKRNKGSGDRTGTFCDKRGCRKMQKKPRRG